MSAPSTGALRRAAGRFVWQWPAVAALTVVWVLLWGDVSWANVLGGAALAALVVVAFPLPRIEDRATFRVLPFLGLLRRFVADLVVASFQVAWVAVRPGPLPRGAVVEVQLRNPDDLFLTVTAVLSTLVPGSLVVEARPDTGRLYVHVLDIAHFDGPEAVRADIRGLEERVLRTLAPSEVLERCGLEG
ncbi:Na+/H+ antiporter subunit E [Isoptericola chiayiensis]|uniref:Na+/H+ antiporter subunit E n=1 Tax=Isoptericola chiayiensis TaxID=579446 RepID=A0ABP8YB32_9MICO|nr:Na+/H+ antiporter subunit E [Isoptericola chiayiensis]NOW00801.1 multicomponent Na+:H+ antiporter subunit E [Isoptericola chiayiensis]